MTMIALLTMAALSQTDYAKGEQVDAWTRHPVFGDPSSDAFERAPNNPLHRGAPPFEWPVNGFFFEDPPTGHWYVYIGLYAKNYELSEDKSMSCTVYRSTDKGKTWEHLGSPFPEEPHTFRGDTDTVGRRPDVSVVYEDGLYHMIYDWASTRTTWATAVNPTGGVDNGIAYACAERPEGPFITTPEPVLRTSAQPLRRGKYRRSYAASLVRRSEDWLVLFMQDSGPNFSWALLGMTAKEPQGPYSEPVFLRAVEDPYFHPPLMEFFPAFTAFGRVYAPATSVARNRNFQALFSAPLDASMDPAAWGVTQHGSVWHAEDVPHEHYGIWGQTFSGFIDGEGIFRAMFPSRDPEGIGTINIAARPWNRPFRDAFVLTGHGGPSLTLHRRTATAFDIDAALKVRGRAAIVWDYRAPLGPDKPAADAVLHPLTLTRHSGLELEGNAWRLFQVDETGTRADIAHGTAAGGDWAIGLRREADATVRLSIAGDEAWSGPWPKETGAIGVFVAPDSRIEVSRFALKAAEVPATCSLLYTEGILGAGAAHGFWEDKEDSVFRFGKGAVSTGPGSVAKWNFEGWGFALWAPRGPGYGKAEIRLDGQLLETVDFHADTPQPSQPLLSRTYLPGSFHAVTVTAVEGSVPIDSLDVHLAT